jgi:hypothetical protein
MIEVKARIEVSGGGRRFSVEGKVRRPNRYLQKPDALRGAASAAADEAAGNLPEALRDEDPPRVVFVGARGMNPNVGRYDFTLSDGSPFACFVRFSTGAVKSLNDEISPDELAEVCRLIKEERERSDAESARRTSRRGESVS